MSRKTLVLVPLLFVFAGCGLIGQPIADKVAKVVVKYFTEPYSARQLYRETINAELFKYGHELHVHCAGDPEKQ